MDENIKKKFNDQAESAIADGDRMVKNFATKIIPTGIWCAATVWGSIALALNANAGPLYIVLGVIASAGAIATTVNVYRNFNK